ncbi:MAG: hypothetical protein HQ472_00275 [Ignavibacteria bacterium]|nr:hypothetical protein [Ignavibacteria bacterium]
MTLLKSRAGLVAFAAIGAVIVLSSCTCKIKDEQKAMINQLRADEKQLTADIEKAEKDKTRINNELASREGEVRKCTERKNFVQDKLNKFPDMWPDWKVTPDPVPVPPPPTKMKR